MVLETLVLGIKTDISEARRRNRASRLALWSKSHPYTTNQHSEINMAQKGTCKVCQAFSLTVLAREVSSAV